MKIWTSNSLQMNQQLFRINVCEHVMQIDILRAKRFEGVGWLSFCLWYLQKALVIEFFWHQISMNERNRENYLTVLYFGICFPIKALYSTEEDLLLFQLSFWNISLNLVFRKLGDLIYNTSLSKDNSSWK